MSLTRKEEKKLIELAKRGDSEAMTTIYQEFGEEILRAAYGISKNKDDAQDIASEAFVSFFKSIEKFDTKYPIRPWLHRIAHNQANSFFRKKNRYITGTECFKNYSNEFEDRVDEVMMDSEEVKIMNVCMQELKPQDKKLLELFYIEGFSISDVAIVIDIPEGTVKSRLFSVRKKLAKKISLYKKGGQHE
ncbi:MAG: RNA polymerase sigma factor [Caldisericia bacterium]|nr:RNA polymerase sigma factor [Caldisericia bacterium]